MTHCDGYRAAAVALDGRGRTVGIDAEPHGPLPDGVLRGDRHARRERLAGRRAGDGSGGLLGPAAVQRQGVVYKAWFPLTRRWLDFEEALVTPDPEAGTFTARLLVPGPVVDGRG